MTFKSALISSRGRQFGVVDVPDDVESDPAGLERFLRSIHPPFPQVPTILIVRNQTGDPSFYGDSGLVLAFQALPQESVVWSDYAVT
jgi:hypothetical protein